MNNTKLVGRLTVTPELRTTPQGTPVTSFSVAINNGKDKAATFVPVVAWGKLAEFVCKYFQKGNGIGLEGRLQSRSYEKDGQKRSVVEVVVNRAEFLPTAKKAASSIPAEVAPAAPAVMPEPERDYAAEDFPF